MRTRFIAAAIVVLGLSTGPALAQSPAKLEIAAQVSAMRLTGIDATDSGIGARIAWHVTDAIALEGVTDFFPTGRFDVPRGGRKLRALAGPTIGWRTERFGVFGKARAGIARVSEGRLDGVCILIFPPPEGCYAADTRPAFDLGGGFEVYPSVRTSLRIDVGELVTRLSPKSMRFGRSGDFAHDLDVTGSVGFRF
jgi:hypothetical protein